MSIKRQPKGIPEGGQFARSSTPDEQHSLPLDLNSQPTVSVKCDFQGLDFEIALQDGKWKTAEVGLLNPKLIRKAGIKTLIDGDTRHHMHKLMKKDYKKAATSYLLGNIVGEFIDDGFIQPEDAYDAIKVYEGLPVPRSQIWTSTIQMSILKSILEERQRRITKSPNDPPKYQPDWMIDGLINLPKELDRRSYIQDRLNTAWPWDNLAVSKDADDYKWDYALGGNPDRVYVTEARNYSRELRDVIKDWLEEITSVTTRWMGRPNKIVSYCYKNELTSDASFFAEEFDKATAIMRTIDTSQRPDDADSSYLDMIPAELLALVINSKSHQLRQSVPLIKKWLEQHNYHLSNLALGSAHTLEDLTIFLINAATHKETTPDNASSIASLAAIAELHDDYNITADNTDNIVQAIKGWVGARVEESELHIPRDATPMEKDDRTHLLQKIFKKHTPVINRISQARYEMFADKFDES